MDGESHFINLPMISKYMLLDGIDGGSGEKTTAETGNEDLGSWISAESIEKIDEKWNEIATKDNIYSESDALIETPDGEVKAKRYSFKLENQQFKEYIVAFMEVLKEDTVLKEKIAGNSFMQNAEGFDVEVLFENFAESLKSAEVVSFESSDYVDIDGYVVNDVVKYELRFANSPMGGLKGMKMRIENVRYDIEKDVEINIPELTEENTIDSENMKEGMPFMFEDIFNKKE